jgi:NhaP-type Na+/H+ or K+/H+ antiporter
LELKAAYCLAIAIAFVIAGEKSKYKDTKYIGSLTFGYVAYRVWGEHKPTKELSWAWWAVQCIFFGCVGAALLFSQIRNSDLGYGFVCIICGVTVRLCAVMVLSHWPRHFYTIKERAFMACAWFPKATVQAALCGVILTDAKAQGNKEVQFYGNIIQTVSIFSIIICAPIGAFLISTFGPKLLPQTLDEPEQKGGMH